MLAMVEAMGMAELHAGASDAGELMGVLQVDRP
jgi:hypothetical protein